MYLCLVDTLWMFVKYICVYLVDTLWMIVKYMKFSSVNYETLEKYIFILPK